MAATSPQQPDLQRRLGLDAKIYRRLERLARKNDRTVIAEVRRAVIVHLANETEGRTDGRV